MVYCYLSENSLSGEIPQTLSNISSLLDLSLSVNMLENALPSNIGDAFPNLQNLFVGGNTFQGQIPASLGNASGLGQIDLSLNGFSGQIPSSFGRMGALYYLNLELNKLEARDDEGWEFFHALANCTRLQGISVANNQLQGVIPNSIENNFNGSIPPGLGNLQRMSTLNLSYNNFQGSIPVEFGKLMPLTTLDLSSNKFSGKIPETFGQFQQINTIRMDQNLLTGNIPTTFSNLKTLSILNLSHNDLSGPVPDCLSDLELLLKLDLSYNSFQGEIPRNGVFTNATIVSLEGNSGLCGGATDFHVPACHFAHRRVEIIKYLVKILIPTFGFMSLMMLIYIYIIIHGKTTSRRPNILFSFGKKFPKVSYKDLAQATGNFSESSLIGRGSYGSVYKAKLTQAKVLVAIKVFDLEMRCASRSFILECEVLRSIRHRNLLPILTAVSTIDNSGNDLKALIYVFMQNGNLDTWLHHRPGVAPKRLGLIQRMNISISIADALAYLHYDCGKPIVHCDLKPTNILLDDDMNAHLGDFGIAGLVLDSSLTAVGHSGPNSSVAAMGTVGYIAPEYGQSVHASTCGDVYSFGILLLEMLIGKRPTDSMFGDDLTIVSFVVRNFPDHMLGKMDAHIQEDCKGSIQAMPEAEKEVYQCLLSLVQLALSCTRLFPRERMNMREVAINLHAIRRSYDAAIKQE
ncbi:unnamed protein product [Urochloa humidicola]